MRRRTGRVSPTGAVLAVFLPAMLLAQTSPTCPGGRKASGDLGIVALRCVGPGAACAIYQPGADGLPEHSFAVEPVVTELTPQAEQAGVLKVGDTLVALDGRLITTGEGGRYMARLAAGRDVSVTVRRYGRILERRVRTGQGCGIRSLSVGPAKK